MKMISIVLKTGCFWLFQLLVSSSAFPANSLQVVKSHPIDKVATLHLPKDERGWKKVMDPKEGYSSVGIIPANQAPEKCSELVTLYAFYDEDLNRKTSSGEKLSRRAHKDIADANPGKKLTWKVLRTGEFDFLHESILESPNKDIPPCHDLSRSFLTEEGVIQVFFGRLDRLMSKEERDKWIAVLEDVTLANAVKNCSLPLYNRAMEDDIRELRKEIGFYNGN